MPDTLFIDFETFSAADLKKCGAHAYAEHPTTGVWCMSYAFDAEPVRILKFENGRVDLPVRIVEHVHRGGRVVAHNAPFEHVIWNSVCVPKYGWCPVIVEQFTCTLALAYAMALPGALERVAPAMGIEAQKDMQGHRIMMQVSKPRSVETCSRCQGAGVLHARMPHGVIEETCLFCDQGLVITWWTPETSPEKFEQLWTYCMQDLEVERVLFYRLMQLSPEERKVWELDQKINNRGIRIDLEAVHAALALVAEEKKRLDQRIREVSGGFISSTRSVADIKKWLAHRGLEVDGLAKGDVVDLLTDKCLPEDCREALLCRQAAAKSSNSKLEAMLERACADGRVRGTTQYCAAGTGRWGGRGLQVHNFPRPLLSQEDIERVFALLGRTA